MAANNLLAARGAKYMVAYEMFARVSASRSLDVLRHTKCLCFAKLGTESGARYGFTLFLSGYGKGDRISVGTDQQAGKWWDFFKPRGPTGQSDGQDEGQRHDHHAHVQERDGRGQHRQQRPAPSVGWPHGSPAVRRS